MSYSNFINTAPSISSGHAFSSEDYIWNIGWEIPYCFRESDGNALKGIFLDTVTGGITLTVNGIEVEPGQFITAQDLNTLNVVPDENLYGDSVGAFTFRYVDDGGTENGGNDTSATSSWTFSYSAVNDAPTAADAVIEIGEDAPYTLNVADFGFADVDGDALGAVVVTQLPETGMLMLDGVAVSANQSISAADIASGKLVWHPPEDANSAGLASFLFKVVDDASRGTYYGSGPKTLQSLSSYTLTLDMEDAPTAINAVVRTEEDGKYVVGVADFGFLDGDGDALSAIVVEQLPETGALLLDGVAVSANQSISAADIGSGKLVWVPPANANGSALASLVFKVVDDADGAAQRQSLSSYTLTFDVTAVNDAPVVSSVIAARTAFEDDVFAFTFASGTFSDVDAGDTLTYSAELADGGALPDWLSFDGATRTFSGTPGQRDAGDLVVKVTATDGDGESVSTTFDLTVENVNDGPVLVARSAATREDSRVSIDVLSDAFDEDGDTLSVTGATVLSGFGSVSIGENGTLVYDPTTAVNQNLVAGQSRKVVIRYTVEDGNGGEATADVTVTVSGVNNDVFKGAASRDVLKGSMHGDTLSGYGGNDLLDGGRGADRMYGGTGQDTYIVDDRADRAIEIRGQGIDLVKASVSFALGGHVENLTLTGGGKLNGTGNGLANTVTGNGGANVLKGMGGNDALKGLGGRDSLEGGSGADKLYAGGGADKLYAGSGADRLYGGSGADKLYGGSGADQFVFLSHRDSTVAARGRDTIEDFSRSQRDKINLKAIDADATHRGNQKFDFIGTEKFHKDAGELRFQKQGGDTLLLADRNGDGKADFSILLDGHIAFKAGDFIL